MADRPRFPDNGDDTGVGADHGSSTGTPRWVKVFGTIVAVVVLLFVIVLLTRGPGGHGPGRHSQSGETGGRTPPASVVDDRASFAGLGGPTRRSDGQE
jgi:hypothetical protein